MPSRHTNGNHRHPRPHTCFVQDLNTLDVSTKGRHVDGCAPLGRAGEWPLVETEAITDTACHRNISSCTNSTWGPLCPRGRGETASHLRVHLVQPRAPACCGWYPLQWCPCITDRNRLQQIPVICLQSC